MLLTSASFFLPTTPETSCADLVAICDDLAKKVGLSNRSANLPQSPQARQRGFCLRRGADILCWLSEM